MMAYEKITMLPPNVSKMFSFPLQGDNQLVRTGTIGDGSCLLHALFHAYSLDYAHMTDAKKMELVTKLRVTMAKKVDRPKWKSLNTGTLALVSFQIILSKLLSNTYMFLSKKKTDTKVKSVSLKNVCDKLVLNEDRSRLVYSSLVELIPLKCVTDIIDRSTYKDVDACKKSVLIDTDKLIRKKLSTSKFEAERIEFVTAKFALMMSSILEESENSAYSKYIQNLENSASHIDQYQIGLISEKFDYDIYFVNAKTRLPYMTGVAYKRRQSVVVLWVDEKHYEIIGRVIPGTKKVQRVFEPDDPLIDVLYMLNCEPKKFGTKYPKYASYLPADVRNAIANDDEDSDIYSE
jgi:hypothetical protein